MKLTIEDWDRDFFPQGKKFVFENKVEADWDFMFECLQKYRDGLKMKAIREDSLGRQLVVQGQVDKLDALFKKYMEFILMVEHWRYEM